MTAGIAPSPFAGVGENVIRAIASYAGKPVAVWRNGKPGFAYGLTETRRFTIAPPGALPLRSRLFSLVDVPDLRALPRLWPGLRSVWTGAGPVPQILHRVLIGLAWLVRLKLLPTLAPLAGLFHRIVNIFRWGEHRGGMFVVVEGSTKDGPVEQSWHLLVEGDDGPFIPSMACELIVRRCLAGGWPSPGARSAAGELSLAEYAAPFARRAITTGIREINPGSSCLPLYRRILGSAFDKLPEPIRAMHDLTGSTTVSGRADIDRGTNILAKLAAAVFGFPTAGRNIPIEVHFEVKYGVEIWRRDFAGKAFSSVQSEGTGRSAWLLLERFGPFTFGLAILAGSGRLTLKLRRWGFLGIPLPLLLAPRSDSYEFVESGRFNFHVELKLPLAGLIVRYRGWLVPPESKNRSAPDASPA